jgi:hypothetical protein
MFYLSHKRCVIVSSNFWSFILSTDIFVFRLTSFVDQRSQGYSYKNNNKNNIRNNNNNNNSLF